MNRPSARVIAAAVLLLLAGCAVGPNYKRPAAPAPVAFKEQPPPGWKEAQPGDALLKGKWWELYNDPTLNALEEQVTVSNHLFWIVAALLIGSGVAIVRALHIQIGRAHV